MTEGAAGAQAEKQSGFNRNSAPSQLKITDMRSVLVASNFDYPIIRIDTNQGVYGLGEVRDAGREGTALVLKPHLIGKNPLQIEPILDSVRNFANQQRMGGGYSAVDMALHDIAGKVYGVPAWRLIGSKYRDKIRIYCDTTESNDPEGLRRAFQAAGRRRASRSSRWTSARSLVANRPGAVNDHRAATEKGLGYLCEYIQAVRDVIGWEAPLAADHFGPLTVNDAIRYARAFEKYDLAWAEDMIQVGHLGAGGDAPKNWRAYKELKEVDHHAHLHGRKPVRPGGRLPRPDRKPRGRYHPSRSAHLGRDPRDQAHRRFRRDARRADGDSLRRIAGGLHGVASTWRRR